MTPRMGRSTGKRTSESSSSNSQEDVEEAKSDSSYEVGANNPDAIHSAQRHVAEDINYFFDRKSGEETVCKFCK